MEIVSCALCGSNNTTVVAKKGILHKFGAAFDVRNVICNVCGLVFINPRPTNEEYEKIYLQYGEKRHSLDTKEAIEQYVKMAGVKNKGAQIVDFLMNFIKPGGTALDIGTGAGSVAVALRDHLKMKVEGIEPGVSLAKTVSDLQNFPVFNGNLDDFLKKYPDKKFDLLILHHVFEHFTDPAQRLREFLSMLNSGGLVYMEVPNVLDFKKPMYQFFDLLHPYSYSPVTLAMMLARSGFKIIAWNKNKRWRIQVLIAPMADQRPALETIELKDPSIATATKHFLWRRRLNDMVTAPFRWLKKISYEEQ